MKNQIAEIASKLISFKTVNGEISEVLKLYEYVQDLFKDKNYSVEIDSTPEAPILIIKPKESEPRVYMCCHIDVVEGKKFQFKPIIKNNLIYGRGAYDMKTQTASCIATLLNNDLNAGLILTSDEEAPKSLNGASYVANLLKNKVDLVIVPDGEAAFGITSRVKGMAEYQFISKGKSSRYSYPWKGINPYPNLMRLYLALDEIFPDAKKANDNDIWYTTYSLISIDARDGSQIPDVGRMHLLVNLTTEFNKESLNKTLVNFAKKFNCEAREIFFGAPYEVESNKFQSEFKSKLDEANGKETELLTMSAISDVRHFSEKGINTILCRIDGSGAHSPEEYADLNSAVVLYEALVKFLTKFRQIV
jgi:succinyl-diaminopimelate desuccinylase